MFHGRILILNEINVFLFVKMANLISKTMNLLINSTVLLLKLYLCLFFEISFKTRLVRLSQMKFIQGAQPGKRFGTV
jgi:hypothetical protein